MTKQLLTALALVALGLIGISLAFCSAFLDVSLPPAHKLNVSEDVLTLFFIVSFFAGTISLCVAAVIWDEVREEWRQRSRQHLFRDIKQEIRDHRKATARR